ncbi:MAG: CoA-transferase subunit beta, partial [Vicinamibacteria bacterium]
REGSDPTLKDPTLLVTDLAVYAFEGTLAELAVRSIHPGVTRDELLARIPWDIPLPDPLPVTPLPDDNDLAVLRDVRQTEP